MKLPEDVQWQYPNVSFENIDSDEHHGLPSESSAMHRLYVIPLYSNGKWHCLPMPGPSMIPPVPMSDFECDTS